MSMASCQDQVTPGFWHLQGHYNLINFINKMTPPYDVFLCKQQVCVKLKFLSIVPLFAVSHRNRSLATLDFFVVDTSDFGDNTLDHTAASRLASLYPAIAMCSMTSSSSMSSCHHQDIPPCHKTSWSSLSPDPKSEFSP